MRASGRLRLAAILAISATAAVMLAATAAAGVAFHDRFHDEGSFVISDFCGVTGMNVELAFDADVSIQAVPHGADGLIHFIEHVKETDVFTNLANGNSVTSVLKDVGKDLRVTDNGDGTLTILVIGTGNDVLYDEDGNVLARNPGQTRFEILVDNGGTPTDPSDDEFLEFLGVVKDSTGRNDDFCEAAIPELS
jgi:Ca2+-binding RTX toxin-like protein